MPLSYLPSISDALQEQLHLKATSDSIISSSAYAVYRRLVEHPEMNTAYKTLQSDSSDNRKIADYITYASFLTVRVQSIEPISRREYTQRLEDAARAIRRVRNSLHGLAALGMEFQSPLNDPLSILLQCVDDKSIKYAIDNILIERHFTFLDLPSLEDFLGALANALEKEHTTTAKRPVYEASSSIRRAPPNLRNPIRFRSVLLSRRLCDRYIHTFSRRRFKVIATITNTCLDLDEHFELTSNSVRVDYLRYTKSSDN